MEISGGAVFIPGPRSRRSRAQAPSWETYKARKPRDAQGVEFF